jgi:membrane protein implicated in regulation of membrane protease activity
MTNPEETRRSTTSVALVGAALALFALAVVLLVVMVVIGEFKLWLGMLALASAVAGYLILELMTSVIWDPDLGPIWRWLPRSRSMVGETAEVRQRDMVFLSGALWKAESDQPLVPGEKVTVIGVSGLTLKVAKYESQSTLPRDEKS